MNPIIKKVDKQVLAAIEKGIEPDLSMVENPTAYFTGLIKRQGMQKSWSVVNSLRQTLRGVGYGLSHLIKWSYEYFSHEQAQANQEFYFATQALELDLHFYESKRRAVAKFYDEDYESEIMAWDIEEANQAWDIEEANQAKELLDSLVDLSQAILTVSPPIVEGIDPVGLISEVLPIFQGFQAFLPEFMATLDKHNILWLTHRNRERVDTPKLEITLPETVEKAFLPLQEMLQKSHEPIGVTKGVGDFQGFCIGLVQAPGSPDERDLHGNWISKEDLERACDKWAFNHAVVGIGHTDFPEEQGINHPHFVILRNWIQMGDTTIGGRLVKDGSWLQAYQANSEWAMNALENFEINGLSPGGSARFITD
jgi:hypothetical protein